jgi:hypothetical protein
MARPCASHRARVCVVRLRRVHTIAHALTKRGWDEGGGGGNRTSCVWRLVVPPRMPQARRSPPSNGGAHAAAPPWRRVGSGHVWRSLCCAAQACSTSWPVGGLARCGRRTPTSCHACDRAAAVDGSEHGRPAQADTTSPPPPPSLPSISPTPATPTLALARSRGATAPKVRRIAAGLAMRPPAVTSAETAAPWGAGVGGVESRRRSNLNSPTPLPASSIGVLLPWRPPRAPARALACTRHSLAGRVCWCSAVYLRGRAAHACRESDAEPARPCLGRQWQVSR